jgi:hypothetical protein
MVTQPVISKALRNALVYDRNTRREGLNVDGLKAELNTRAPGVYKNYTRDQLRKKLQHLTGLSPIDLDKNDPKTTRKCRRRTAHPAKVSASPVGTLKKTQSVHKPTADTDADTVMLEFSMFCKNTVEHPTQRGPHVYDDIDSILDTMTVSVSKKYSHITYNQEIFGVHFFNNGTFNVTYTGKPQNKSAQLFLGKINPLQDQTWLAELQRLLAPYLPIHKMVLSSKRYNKCGMLWARSLDPSGVIKYTPEPEQEFTLGTILTVTGTARVAIARLIAANVTVTAADLLAFSPNIFDTDVCMHLMDTTATVKIMDVPASIEVSPKAGGQPSSVIEIPPELAQGDAWIDRVVQALCNRKCLPAGCKVSARIPNYSESSDYPGFRVTRTYSYWPLNSSLPKQETP